MELQSILILGAFVVTIIILYRTFKLILRGTLVAVAGFSFPWIVYYLGLPIPIIPSIETGIQFAILGISLFLIYEFFHFLKYIIKIIAWPFRKLAKKK